MKDDVVTGRIVGPYDGPMIETAKWDAAVFCTPAGSPRLPSASFARVDLVHNHGSEDGPGLACRERRLEDGSLRGACLDAADAIFWKGFDS